jgi:hypothetical protein
MHVTQRFDENAEIAKNQKESIKGQRSNHPTNSGNG